MRITSFGAEVFNRTLSTRARTLSQIAPAFFKARKAHRDARNRRRLAQWNAPGAYTLTKEGSASKAPAPGSPRLQGSVTAEIAALREILPRLPQFSAFDDDHHAAVEAQIELLEHGVPAEAHSDESTQWHALQAAEWQRGNLSEAPSIDWRSLLPTDGAESPMGESVGGAGR